MHVDSEQDTILTCAKNDKRRSKSVELM